MRKFIFLIFFVLFSTFIIRCEKEEEIHAIFLCLLNNAEQEAQLISDPIADPNQVEVVIKWDTLTHTFPFIEWDWSGIYLYDTLSLDTLEDYKIRLESDVGNCEGTVTLPGYTAFPEIQLNDTFPLGEDITVAWDTAQGADYYNIFYDLATFDSTGLFIGWVYDTVIYTYSTSIIIPYSVFNKLDSPYYLVLFRVTPCSGVMPVPEDSGNMTGSVIGFLVAEGIGHMTYFWVGEPAKKSFKVAPTTQLPTIKERLNTFREVLGFY